ncbi:MAG TPA: YtxH domain-containing protein [Blastocatellia bacterium]|nr:YtxH domain-containing protein [Blastocatellia bacterium]
MSEDRGNASNSLLFFLIGAGIGAVTALLFAPKAGSELRSELADATRRGLDQARDTGRQIGERATDYYQTGVEKAADLAARGREGVSDLTERGKEAVTRQKASIAAAIEAGKQGYREAKEADQGKAGAAFEES